MIQHYNPLNDGVKVKIFSPIKFEGNSYYYGEWTLDKKNRHGRGIQLYEDNSKYIGQWANDKLKYIFYCLVQYGLIAKGILGVTRLQSVLGGRDLLIKRHVLRRTILEDDLEFINMTKASGGNLALPLFDVNQLGRTGNPVDLTAFGQRTCAIGLHHQIQPMGMQLVAQRCRDLQGGFAACDDHISRGILEHSLNNLVFAHLNTFFKIGVAEPATQVTPCKTHEDGRRSRVMAFALQRIENLVDFQLTINN